jgi:nitrite reductase/ring-hydroxylating ferredoxin subunit
MGQAPNAKNVRKTRAVIVRNTADQLALTTRKTVFDWLPPGEAGIWKAVEKTFILMAKLADGTTVESHERLTHIGMGVRNPVMLIRIKPVDMPRVVKRQGQESFNFGELFAYTKVCSHLGCPSSLYEQQTYRILCPCHQSQFDALHFARPIFGPAARALAQLPITIDQDGYLVANGDFIEPVGPAFWERRS